MDKFFSIAVISFLCFFLYSSHNSYLEIKAATIESCSEKIEILEKENIETEKTLVELTSKNENEDVDMLSSIKESVNSNTEFDIMSILSKFPTRDTNYAVIIVAQKYIDNIKSIEELKLAVEKLENWKYSEGLELSSDITATLDKYNCWGKEKLDGWGRKKA